MTRLRAVLVLLAAVAIAAMAVGLLIGFRAAALLPPGIWVLLLLAAFVFERYRYKPLVDAPPGPGWTDTGERFRDPRTGRQVAVYSDPATGQRAYVSPPR